MNHDNQYYLASCVFTRHYHMLSVRIQDYVTRRFGLQVLRCCVPGYKVNEMTAQIPECARQRWQDTP